jgi:hypothetical protein
MFNRLIFVFFISLGFCSCAEHIDFTDVKINDHYQLSVPDYLHPCTDLHKNAVLQLQNTEEDVYLVVIEEQKSLIKDVGMYYNSDSYYNSVLKQPFTNEIQSAVADSTPVEKQVAGYKTIITSISGTVNNQPVFYKLAVIETPASFYQIIIWTRADKRVQMENYMIKIIESFKKQKE